MSQSGSIASIFLGTQGNARSHRENVSLRAGLVLVVEPYSAVRTKVVSVSRFRGMPAFHPIHAATCYHFAFSLNHQINLLGGFVVMGKVRAAGGEVHPEEAGHNVRV